MKNNTTRFEEDLDDGELTLAELEEIVGGQSLEAASAEFALFEGDVKVADPSQGSQSVDSSYKSFLGATGTTVGSHTGGTPFNITNQFP